MTLKILWKTLARLEKMLSRRFRCENDPEHVHWTFLRCLKREGVPVLDLVPRRWKEC